MQLGMIGLGRMGGNIVRRLMRQGHSTVVYDKDAKAVAGLAADGAVGSRRRSKSSLRNWSGRARPG
ncbi:6-phosphogluconate dehydrogenase (decarboxylating) [Bradyrhizobium sp. GM22.5]